MASLTIKDGAGALVQLLVHEVQPGVYASAHVQTDTEGNPVAPAPSAPDYSVLHLTAANPTASGASDLRAAFTGEPLTQADFEPRDFASTLLRIPMREAGYSGLAIEVGSTLNESGKTEVRVPGGLSATTVLEASAAADEGLNMLHASATNPSEQAGAYPFLVFQFQVFNDPPTSGALELKVHRW